MSDPAYQDIQCKDIPIVQIKDGLEAKVLAGTCHRTNAIVQTKVECQYLDFHVTLSGKSSDSMEFTHIVPERMTTGIVFVYHGSGHHLFWPMETMGHLPNIVALMSLMG